MTRRSRRTIFYALVALFLILGTGIILYAEGWRIDLATFKPEKVGAIFVRSFPVDASITLDGQPVENTAGFLSRGTFISDLTPKNYDLELSESGYDAWHETADVSPTLVTEFKYAVLVPQNATSVATGNVTDFFEAGDNIVTENTSDTISWQGSASGAAATGTVIGKGTAVSHSADFKNIVIRAAAGGYSLYDFTNRTSTNLTAAFARIGIPLVATTTVMVDPYDPTTVIANTGARIASLNLLTATAESIGAVSPGEVMSGAPAISPSFIAWAQIAGTSVAPNHSPSSTIVIYNKFTKTIVGTTTFAGKARELKWIDGATLGVLAADGTLDRYDISSQTFSSLASDVKDFYPSSDGTLLAALESRSIEIFSFTTSDYYRLNLPAMDTVQSLAWYKDESHLFVQYPDHAAFLDVADQELRNIITVSEGTQSFYDTHENSLYLIDQGQKLIRFDFPN